MGRLRSGRKSMSEPDIAAPIPPSPPPPQPPSPSISSPGPWPGGYSFTVQCHPADPSRHVHPVVHPSSFHGSGLLPRKGVSSARPRQHTREPGQFGTTRSSRAGKCTARSPAYSPGPFGSYPPKPSTYYAVRRAFHKETVQDPVFQWTPRDSRLARGQNPPGIRAAMHPGWPLRFTVSRCKDNITFCQSQYTYCCSKASLCVAPRANSPAIHLSSRLASPAPHRSRCSGGFVHGLPGPEVPYCPGPGPGASCPACQARSDRRRVPEDAGRRQDAIWPQGATASRPMDRSR